MYVLFSESKKDVEQQKEGKRLKFPNKRNMSFSFNCERKKKVTEGRNEERNVRKVRKIMIIIIKIDVHNNLLRY